jgi:hypothetical protein
MRIYKQRLCTAAMWLLGAPLISWAGNIYLTGHDLDNHCDINGIQCNALGAAINFVRLGAPNPTLPILFVDSTFSLLVDSARTRGAMIARDTIDGGAISFTLVTPTAFSAASFSLSTSLYSAIAFASACAPTKGCDLGPAEIADINLRTAAIQSFFNRGGGLLYNAGGENDSAAYYSSVPIPATAVAVNIPFTLTAAGKAAPFGLIEGVSGDPVSGPASDDNCCETHNSFTLPGAGSQLIVLETDTLGRAETLAAGKVTISGGGFVGAVTTPEPGSAVLIFAAVLLFALRAFAQRDGLWRDRWARHRITGRT